MSVYTSMVEKRFIKRVLQKIGEFFSKVRSSLDYKIARVMWASLSKKTKVIPNQIMFHTYQDKYTCNPKYLCEELIASGLDYNIVWVISSKTGDDLSQFPSKVNLVRHGTYEYYKAMAASKFWIDNAHNFTWEAFPKKEEQIYINLWHGSLGLKRINAEADSHKRRRRAGKRANKITNYVVSNSEFEDMVYSTSYWPDVEKPKFGHCRNDLMFASDEKKAVLKKKVCKALGISEEKKILLYAPTFRDGSSLDYCDIDYKSLKEALDEKFGGEWVILSRLHFHVLLKYRDRVANMRSGMEYVIVADDYNDMQELLAVSDIGITDYSSWICDFALTKKPGFLFVTDVDSYVTERGFYYPLEDTPFAICKSNEELIASVKDYDDMNYQKKLKEYLDKLGCVEDGEASKRVIKLIEKSRISVD